MIYVTSDWHLHHANLVQGGRIATRPFRTVSEMNECIVENINATCKPTDKLWMLGDVTLMRTDPEVWLGICKRIRVPLEYLFVGNHDHYDPWDYDRHAGFQHIVASLTSHKCLFSHVPIHPSQFYRFKAHIHGHTHEKLVPAGAGDVGMNLNGQRVDPRYINVCVETRDYKPVSLEQLMAEVAAI